VRLLRAQSFFQSLFSAMLPCMPGCSMGSACYLQYLRQTASGCSGMHVHLVHVIRPSLVSSVWTSVLMCCCCKHRKLRAEEALKARLEEEAIMEARRVELLSEEGGYWSRRMAAEQAAAEQLAAAQQALIEVSCLMSNGARCPHSRAASCRRYSVM
jgi:hypothetical protein